MAKWLAKEFDWDTGRYTGRYYDIAEAGVVAVFVDSFYGDDASADPEDPDLPLKTLGAAITYLNTNGANGSRIFMNGIFTETLPTQTYWYEYIGCGGGRNGKTVFYASANIITVKLSGNTYNSIELINYEGAEFMPLTSSGLIRNSMRVVNSILSNCAIEPSSDSAISSKVVDSILYNVIGESELNYGQRLYCYDSVLFNYKKTGLRDIQLYGSNNYFTSDPDSTRNFVLTNFLNYYSLEAQFIDPVNRDFSVRITSPLLGAGPIDEITGNPKNIGGVRLGLTYNGLISEFSEAGGATITDLTIDNTGKYTITAPATSGTLETALMDLGNIYPLENIDLFNVFDFLSGEITQGVFETFSSPRMALTIKLKYGLTSTEVDDCPWLLIEYGKQPTFSGTGASRVGNAADTFDPDTFETITCRYMKLFVTLQNNS